MSGLDASFLYFETPSMHMHVVGTVVLDPTGAPGWGPGRVAELLRERLALIPPFRQRLQPSMLRLHHPVWVDVPDVDVTQHLSVRTCPSPGTDAELAQVVADFAGQPLDRSRPLWEVLVVEGLAQGRAAVVIKVHHSAVDGVGAANVLSALFDLEPQGRSEQQVHDLAELTDGAGSPPLRAQVAHAATGVLTRPLGLVRLVPTAARSVARLARVRGDERTGSGGAVPFVAPRAAFNGRISPRRVVAFADVPVDDVKAVKTALGGTFNDVVIAVCGGALRRYLQARRALPPTSLIAVCPVSVRAEQEGGNAVSAMFTALATDVADPAERYAAVRRANDVGKADHEAIGGRLLQQAAQIAPPTMTSIAARVYSSVRLANLHPVVHNVVISNVPGPPVQLWFGGASIEALYPLGPVLEGPALNLTVVSYRDRVGFGLIGCAHRIPDLPTSRPPCRRRCASSWTPPPPRPPPTTPLPDPVAVQKASIGPEDTTRSGSGVSRAGCGSPRVPSRWHARTCSTSGGAVQFTVAVAMTDPTHYTALARTAEECGFSQVAVPDSSFWSEQVSDAYPYTADGGRMWTERTPFVDPFMAVTAMAAVTERIRFCTHVVKVGVRNPLLLAKQVATAAVLSGDRFTFGAGVGWLKEEFEWCGQAYEGRGTRVDESLDAILQVLTGEWTSYEGEHVRFGRLKMPPAPAARVPVYIGGHTPVALRRTVRFGDGWTSAMISLDDFRAVHTELTGMLQLAGRQTDGFAFQVASSDRFGLDGYKELAAAGATDVVTVPWVFYGVPMDGELEAKQDGLRQFAADVLEKW